MAAPRCPIVASVGGDRYADAQRQRLLEGLATSICEKGLVETSLSDIVRNARASKRTFYKHFPDKDSCFVALAQALRRDVRRRVYEVIDPEDDWETQVSTTIDAFLAILAANPAMTFTLASAALGPSVVRAQQQAMNEYALMVQRIAGSESFRRAGIEPISFTRAYMLVSGLGQTITRAVERGESFLELAPEFKSVFGAVLVASPVAAPAGAAATSAREP